MRKKLLVALPLAALVFAVSPATWAQSSGPETRLNAQDQQFLSEVGPANHAEVELGTLAKQKADHLSVKEFGFWMESAHGAAGRALASTLTQIPDAKITTAPTPRQSETLQRLRGLSGNEFDRAFLTTMVEDHEKVVPLFEKEATDGENKLLKTFAENLIPALKDHLTEARILDRALYHVTAQNTPTSERFNSTNNR